MVAALVVGVVVEEEQDWSIPCALNTCRSCPSGPVSFDMVECHFAFKSRINNALAKYYIELLRTTVLD